jgi:hypothetical protein
MRVTETRIAELLARAYGASGRGPFRPPRHPKRPRRYPPRKPKNARGQIETFGRLVGLHAEPR